MATKSCGASDAFVRDKLNGFLFDPGDHEGLVNILRTISSLEQVVLQDFSKMSLELAQTYNPDIWVKSLVEIHESPQATECRRKKKERSRLKDIFRRITKLREHS